MLQALLRRNLGIPPLTPKGNLDGTGGFSPFFCLLLISQL